MGQIKKGILGSFSGRVGTVIGSHWKQIDYIRSMPSHHHDAKTPKQMEQRLKLALLSEYLKIMLPFIDIGFKNSKNNTSPFNAAFKYNFANAFYGDYPNIRLDLAYILLSHGSTKGTDYAHISQIVCA
ncbi:hypothetical protein FACS1894199_19310 [Bacteroidia bacterium]|nr:hypothetical protein FACS1894199_19310 [Bacteroidia bacterium]